jgi:N-methylhydantoinase A
MDEIGRMGVDIGGTFTDIVLVTDRGQTIHRKIPSTPAHPEQAVLVGIRVVLLEAGLEPGAIESVLHGTTVGSNAILQMQGGRCGLITTHGFRDVLEIGRLRTPGMFDLSWDKPKPLIPRRYRREVNERIGADGAVITPLDTAQVLEAGDYFQSENLESIAVCFINSYRNPEHENAAATVLRQTYPELSVTTSVSVLPEQREYERTSTTVVNAYVLPVMRDYLKMLQSELLAMGITAPVFVANSNGGLARAAFAEEKPVYFISSGRAAGVAGAAHLGRQVGEPDLVAFDMGGTTASASLIRGGELTRTTEYEFRAGVSTPSRFIKAGGYLMRVPTVDVAEIGSGGGSIAYVDAGGLTRVGPVSAGAVPGPACYGTGGTKPTVTDANLVLGYLPDRLAGGTMVLNAADARAAVEREVATPLGLSIDDAAFGIREIANANMARAIQMVTVERGLDPREFTLLAFGGSGPNHACDLARILGIPKVLFPAAPGVFTATGMLSGAVEHYFIRSLHTGLEDLTQTTLRGVIDDLSAEGRRELAREGHAGDSTRLRFEIDLRFMGQDSELQVELDVSEFEAQFATLRARFLDLYKEKYGYISQDGIETVNVRLTATGAVDEAKRPQPRMPPRAKQAATEPGSRKICFKRGEWQNTAIMARDDFPGTAVGPLAIEGADATLIVPPGARARTDLAGDIVVTFDD